MFPCFVKENLKIDQKSFCFFFYIFFLRLKKTRVIATLSGVLQMNSLNTL